MTRNHDTTNVSTDDRPTANRSTEADPPEVGSAVATLPEHYDPERVEGEVQSHWRSVDAYEYVEQKRAGGEEFYFVDGPPFTTGEMHVGTAWGKLLKDTLLRYERMQGKDVYARPGYDTHGLPVEVQVEAELDVDTKADVEAYGVERFVERCREYASDRVAAMGEQFEDLGVWMDFEDAYRTYDPDYVEAVWSAFGALYDRGLLAQEKRVLNTCPRCETALADSELEYDGRSTTAAYVCFPLVGGPDLLTWTTTPWTVVGNEFVAVDREAEYARVALGDREVFVAADCLSVLAETVEADPELLERLPGEALVGREYDHPLADRLPEHPLADRPPEDPNAEGSLEEGRGGEGKRGRVVHADYVDAEKTGLVHSAPGFGHEDFQRGRELDLPVYSPVGEDGRFTEEAGPYAGQPVREAESAVLDDLAESGSLLATEQFDHEYPHCPRCDTDVLYRATEQWLVTTTDLKEECHDALDDVDYHPEEARDRRFRTVLEEAPDWNVSRQRYWGTPLPVWECRDCSERSVVRSREQLVERSDLDSPPADLHRPSVDDVVVTCPECGGSAHRVEDVLDVWFDSAVASWASLDVLPGEHPDPGQWPADLVVEGQDQTRGWFLMQLYLGVALGGEAAYEEVLMHGFATLDGEPMSKSRGHVLRPSTVVEECGRDALRAHLLSHDQREQDVSLTSDLSGVNTVRDRLDVVWNVVRFATTYMAEDGHEPAPETRVDPGERSAVDRWLLSSLDEVLEQATEAMDRRRPSDALEAVLEFLVEDVSRYYVQSVRDRVWDPEASAEKRAVYDTLGTTLYAVVGLLAPFVPFLADRLYDALGGSEPTVHATDWPTPAGRRDPRLEREVELLRSVEEGVAKARQRAGRKHRWPVRSVVVEGEADLREAVGTHEDHLRERVNAHGVRVTDSFEATDRVVVPQMDQFGPAFGEEAPAVAEAVEGVHPTDLPLAVETDSGTARVTTEMVEVETTLPEGFESVPVDGGTVYVDLATTAELKREGLARDVVRRLQRLRSSLDLDLDQRVRVGVVAESDAVAEAVETHREEVLSAVRGTDLVEKRLDHAATSSLDGGRVEVSLSVPEDATPKSD